MNKKLGFALASLCAIVVAVALNVRNVDASDHLDPSGRVEAGQSTDIGDLYTWHSDGTIKAILTFAGPVPSMDGNYDRDALYAIHIDGNDADFEPDTTIYARFAQNGDGDWGVLIENLPGADGGIIVGEVETNLSSGEAQAFAGQTDDPFFMDLAAFRATVASGDLADYLGPPPEDFFEGLNITALVFEFPTAAVGFAGPYNMWATTAGI